MSLEYVLEDDLEDDPEDDLGDDLEDDPTCSREETRVAGDATEKATSCVSSKTSASLKHKQDQGSRLKGREKESEGWGQINLLRNKKNKATLGS